VNPPVYRVFILDVNLLKITGLKEILECGEEPKRKVELSE
jgi:hypothetical protein